MSDDKKKDGPGFIGAVKNYFNSYTDTDASLRSGSPYAPTTKEGWDEYEARKREKDKKKNRLQDVEVK